MCFCVLLYFTACMLYYCNTVGWAWWDWGLIWWLTILLHCFDTVGWVTWPVKISSPNDLYCVEWVVKPYTTQRRRWNVSDSYAKTSQHFRSANVSLESSICGLFGDIFSFKIKVGVYDEVCSPRRHTTQIKWKISKKVTIVLRKLKRTQKHLQRRLLRTPVCFTVVVKWHFAAAGSPPKPMPAGVVHKSSMIGI